MRTTSPHHLGGIGEADWDHDAIQGGSSQPRPGGGVILAAKIDQLL